MPGTFYETQARRGRQGLSGRLKYRNVAFAVLGAVALVLKPAYHGPLEGVVYSYAGNFSVSFALFFAAINTTERYRRPRLTAAVSTLLAVEAFELSNGFGLMVNVFDPMDLLANAVGIGVAVLVDLATAKLCNSRRDSDGAPSAFVEPADGADARWRAIH